MSLRNRPNPFTSATTVSFVLSGEMDVELRVRDAAGRLLWSEMKHYTAGKHEQVLRLDGASGVLLVELVTQRGPRTLQMLAMGKY